MSPEPAISVIVPTYNAARFLPEALVSVRRQSIAPLEIIVVDDGSTDDTAEWLRHETDVTYVHQPNQGPSAARNAGIRRARGEFLAFLDADDLWTDDHLERLLEPLAADPQLLFAWGQTLVTHIQPDGTQTELVKSPRDGQTIPLFLIGAGLYRPAAFDRVGVFDPEMRLAEDLDWIARARQAACPHALIDAEVLVYRKHAGGITAGKSFSQLNVMSMLRRQIVRQRSPGHAADGAAPIRKAA